MTSVRCNFKNSYDDLTCPVCENPTYQDTQSHILQCKILIENENILAGNQILYSDLFSHDVSKLSVVAFSVLKTVGKKEKTVRVKHATIIAQGIRGMLYFLGSPM